MRRRSLAGLLGAASACWLIGCDGSQPSAGPPSPPAPGVVLEIDGFRITRDDVTQFDAYFDALDPSMGRKYRYREVLAQFLLPLAAARRDFAEQRAELATRAASFRSTVGNSIEVRRLGSARGGYEPANPIARAELPFPAAQWAFDLEHLGAASPVIEAPRGFLVIAAEDLLPGMTRPDDLLKAFIVPFVTHDPDAFAGWWNERRQALRGKVTYLHPDLEGCLPIWLETP